jgi:hypothetical protein
MQIRELGNLKPENPSTQGSLARLCIQADAACSYAINGRCPAIVESDDVAILSKQSAALPGVIVYLGPEFLSL